MREPIFNRGGGKFLFVFVVTIAFGIWYAGIARSFIVSAWWPGIALLVIAPFALGYLVGNEEDRAEYRSVMGWIARKLRLR